MTRNFDLNMSYYSRWTPPPHPEKAYINLLKLCQLWQIDEGTAFAIHHLEKEPMAAARRLQLARLFSIFDWVRPALKELILWDIFLSLSDEQLEQVSLKVYSVITKARAAVEHERRLVAAVPPPMRFEVVWECRVHDTLCSNVWKGFWMKKVAKRLLHPSQPLAFDEIGEFVSKNDNDLTKMTPRCKDAMVEQMGEEAALTEIIIDGAVEAVITFFRSL